MSTNGKTKAAIYARLSLDRDGSGAAVERQQADCEAMAEAEGIEVVEVLVDNDISAYSGKARPAFERLLDLAQSGEVDVVIVWAIDRLYRRVADLGRVVEACKPHGVAVLAVKSGRIDLSTADGRLHAGLLAEVAEHESAKKGERMSARWEQRARRDGVAATAACPFGWRWADPCPGGDDCEHATKCPVGVDTHRPRAGGRKGRVVDPAAAAAVRWAAQWVADGGSLAAAALRLREQGFTGSRGTPMDARRLREALLAPRSAGLTTLHGEVVGDNAEGAILTRELWEQVRAVLDDPKRRTKPGRPARHLLTGLIVCGRCGTPMRGTNQRSRSGVYGAYGCTHMHRRRRVLVEPAVVALVAAVLGKYRGQLLAVAAPTAGPAQVRAAKEVADLHQRLKTLAALAASGDLDPDDFAEVARGVRERLVNAEGQAARIAGLPATAALLKHPRGPVEAWHEAVADDVDTARAVLRELVEKVTVLPPAIPRKPTLTDLDVDLAPWLRELAEDSEGVA